MVKIASHLMVAVMALTALTAVKGESSSNSVEVGRFRFRVMYSVIRRPSIHARPAPHLLLFLPPPSSLSCHKYG